MATSNLIPLIWSSSCLRTSNGKYLSTPHTRQTSHRAYNLFPRLKKELGDQRFVTHEKLADTVKCILKNLDDRFYLDGIEKLVFQLDKCLQKKKKKKKKEDYKENSKYCSFYNKFFWNFPDLFWIFQRLGNKTSSHWMHCPITFQIVIPALIGH